MQTSMFATGSLVEDVGDTLETASITNLGDAVTGLGTAVATYSADVTNIDDNNNIARVRIFDRTTGNIGNDNVLADVNALSQGGNSGNALIRAEALNIGGAGSSGRSIIGANVLTSNAHNASLVGVNALNGSSSKTGLINVNALNESGLNVTVNPSTLPGRAANLPTLRIGSDGTRGGGILGLGRNNR